MSCVAGLLLIQIIPLLLLIQICEVLLCVCVDIYIYKPLDTYTAISWSFKL